MKVLTNLGERLMLWLQRFRKKPKIAEGRRTFVPPVESAPSPDLCENNKVVDEELQRLYNERYNNLPSK